MPPQASVIVRAKDKAGTIEDTFRALRAQTRAVEIVVVDSGSTDGTLELARQWADVLVQIPPEDFSYGGALNVGAGAAGGAFHFALSAHCVPASATWIEESLELYGNPCVAATNHAENRPDGQPVDDVYLQTLDDARRHPNWGFSNHASSWRADVWSSHRFREDLVACEDKEWSWRVLGAGFTIAYSPRLHVPSGHRRGQGARLLHKRMAREAEALVSLGATRPLSSRELFRAWWSSFPIPSRFPSMARRVSPLRLVELAGSQAGARAGVSSRTASEPQQLAPTHGWTPAPQLPWFDPDF